MRNAPPRALKSPTCVIPKFRRAHYSGSYHDPPCLNRSLTRPHKFVPKVYLLISWTMLTTSLERIGAVPRDGTSAGPCPFLHPPIHQHVLGQVRPIIISYFIQVADANAASRCVTGTPSTSFSRNEVSCLSNCVERFLDTSLFMVKKIEEQRQAS